MDGRGPGLVLMSLPPYPREGAWMGMAAMTLGLNVVAREGAGVRGRRQCQSSPRATVRKGLGVGVQNERAEVQGDLRLATAADSDEVLG